MQDVMGQVRLQILRREAACHIADKTDTMGTVVLFCRQKLDAIDLRCGLLRERILILESEAARQVARWTE